MAKVWAFSRCDGKSPIFDRSINYFYGHGFQFANCESLRVILSSIRRLLPLAPAPIGMLAVCGTFGAGMAGVEVPFYAVNLGFSELTLVFPRFVKNG